MKTFRRKITEYEANLYSVEPLSFWARLFGSRKKGGELEFKAYDDGEKLLEVELHALNAPHGAAVSVLIDNAPVCEVMLSQGHGRLLLSTAQGESLPEVSNGSQAEIRYQGETLLSGIFMPD
ncbi:MAG: hypothetical protein L6461_02750 [Anaerolineae bacterium]|nr:hypothetical protein [Anaerolineae bacterium]